MSEREPHSTNSLEVIQPFITSISGARDVQIMGGLATESLKNPGLEIDFDAKEVHAPLGLYLPVHREDGTLRDVDVLVVSSDASRIAEVEGILAETVGTNMERSVFGIRTHEALQAQVAKPLGFRAFRTFVSDRYEAEPDETGTYVKSLFPFAVPIHPEALEPWTLTIGTDDTIRIPIPHPGTTINNYMSRSISGLRPRDTDKMTESVKNVFDSAPEVQAWLLDGPGRSQLDLSIAIASLRFKDPQPFSFVDGLGAHSLSKDALASHEAFMLPELSREDKMRVLGQASFKATALRSVESNRLIVTAWRVFAERFAQGIVKNQ